VQLKAEMRKYVCWRRRGVASGRRGYLQTVVDESDFRLFAAYRQAKAAAVWTEGGRGKSYAGRAFRVTSLRLLE